MRIAFDTRLLEAMHACNTAAEAIAKLEPEQWPGMVTLILEYLDAEPERWSGSGRDFLAAVKDDLETRLDLRWGGGRGGASDSE